MSMPLIRWHAVALAVLWLGSAAAQTNTMRLRGSAEDGRRLYHSSAVSTNGLACGTCHADFDEQQRDDGLIRPGHSLWNSAQRGSWWGKEPGADDSYVNAAAAAVVCMQHYMRSSTRLSAQQMLDLHAYLNSLSPVALRTPLAIAPAADKTGVYAGFESGNHFRGRAGFHAACHVCHPQGGAGIAPAIPRNRKPDFYARKVREGDGLGAVLAGVNPNAYDPASGRFMPFFGADRLTDQQIADIIAFLVNPAGNGP